VEAGMESGMPLDEGARSGARLNFRGSSLSLGQQRCAWRANVANLNHSLATITLEVDV